MLVRWCEATGNLELDQAKRVWLFFMTKKVDTKVGLGIEVFFSVCRWTLRRQKEVQYM